MEKNKLTGFKYVFSFTFSQTLKTKAYSVTLAILLILSLVSMPLITFFTSKGEESGVSKITKAYIDNQSTLLNLDFSEIIKQPDFSQVELIETTESYEAITARIEEKEETAVLLTIKEEMGIYSLHFIKGSNSAVKNADLSRFSEAVKACFDINKMKLSGMNQEQIDLITAKIESRVFLTDSSGTEIIKEDTSITSSEYWFIYIIFFVVLMVNTLASSQVATSIVSDKSSKVVEYLLTSIKPLAIIVGKVFAMLLAVILQFLSIIVGMFVSTKISGILFPEVTENPLSGLISADILNSINPINLFFCFIMIALGLIFYATLAGLAGTTVSRIEEINEGLTLYTIVTMIGAYLGIGAAATLMGAGQNGYVTFTFLFPLSSPYILPGAILAGKVTLPFILGAVALELIAVIILFLFVARVYEILILHSGNPVKIKELIKLSKKA